MSYEDNQKVFGIGKTSDLKKRLKQFNTSKSITKIDFVCHFEFLTSEEHFVEKQIHKSLKQLGFKHPIVDGKEKKELFYFQHKIEDTVILIKNIINDLKINFVFNITKRFDFIVKYIDNKIHKPLTENGCQVITNKVEKKDNGYNYTQPNKINYNSVENTIQSTKMIFIIMLLCFFFLIHFGKFLIP